MKKIKIGISGKANTGKDTLAKILAKDLGIDNNYLKIAFADPLKSIILDTYPEADRESLWGPSERREDIIPNAFKMTRDSAEFLQKEPLSYRQSLLDLGKLGRYYDPDIWSLATVYDANNSDKNIIISDIRFKNELKILKEEEFILIRLLRPNNHYSVNDISDKDLDDTLDSYFDFVIINDSDFDSFCNKINKLASEIKEKYQ